MKDCIRGGGESAAKALRLKDDRDWDFVCVAMDVVGDASLAIGNSAYRADSEADNIS